MVKTKDTGGYAWVVESADQSKEEGYEPKDASSAQAESPPLEIVSMELEIHTKEQEVPPNSILTHPMDVIEVRPIQNLTSKQELKKSSQCYSTIRATYTHKLPAWFLSGTMNNIFSFS